MTVIYGRNGYICNAYLLRFCSSIGGLFSSNLIMPARIVYCQKVKGYNMIDANVLRGINFFDGLTASELSQISKYVGIVKLKKGDNIFTRGDNAEDFYIVRSGKVHLSFPISILNAVQDIVVDTIMTGDFFGWSALVGHYKLTLSAYCDEDCELIQIRGNDVLSLCAKEHHMGFILMGNLVKVIGGRMDRIQGLFKKEIELNVPSL